MDISQRFLAVMRHSKLNNGDFALKIGASQGAISHINSGRNKPSLDMMISILAHYPEVSAEWFIRGKGEMIQPNKVADIKTDLLKLLEEIKLVNTMNYNSMGGRIEILENKLKA